MNIAEGFANIFNLFPSQRSADEILDEFYENHPYIERDDNIALQNDLKVLEKDLNNILLKRYNYVGRNDIFGNIK
jgi:hypothetical protein